MIAKSSLDSNHAAERRTRLMAILAIGSITVMLVAYRFWPSADSALLRKEAVEAATEGRWDDAELALRRIHDPTPSDWLMRASVAHDRKDEEAATTFLKQVPPEGPLASQAAFLSGQIAQGRHQASVMESALRRAIELDPQLLSARKLLVYLYGIQQRRADLMEQFAAIADQGPLSFELVHHWCVSHGEIAKPAEVRSELEAFLAADSDDRASRLALADAYRRMGRTDQAEATLRPLTNIDPLARAARAQIALDLGDTKKAGDLLAVGPSDYPKLAHLRGRLALALRDPKTAVRSLHLADAGDPENPEILFVLVQALRANGDAAEADRVGQQLATHQELRRLLKHVSVNPERTPEILFQLAEACEAVGQIAQARAWYRVVIAADPLNAKAQRALFRLGSAQVGTRTKATSRGKLP